MEGGRGEVTHIAEGRGIRMERYAERFQELLAQVLEQYDFLLEQEQMRQELMQEEVAKPFERVNWGLVEALQDELTEIEGLQDELDIEIAILHGKDDILREARAEIVERPDLAQTSINKLVDRIGVFNDSRSFREIRRQLRPLGLDSKPENSNTA
jgi:hypothetical protein